MHSILSLLFRLFVLALSLPALSAFAADRPNILWLTSEDHGLEMGCYGDPNGRTPNMDALAAKGMIYRKVWSNHPVCAPARTAIISGLHANSSGGIHMRSMVPMPAGTKMYPEFLREAGYYCTNHFKEDYNLPKTAETWDESSDRAHWRNRRGGQPFFAVFNSSRSHESRIRTRPHQPLTDPAAVRVPAYHPDVPEVRRDWAQYYDKIGEADADAGARLREVEEAGLAGETIVFYYGDHGSGMPRSKRWPSNSGLHVPLIVYFPEKWKHLAPDDYVPGGQSSRLVSFVDLAPTVLSLAGVRPPAWMQGSAFAGPHQAPAPAFLHGARGRMDERDDLVRSITDGRYVYLRNYVPNVSQGQRIVYQFETPTTRIWREWFDAGKTNEAQSIFWRVPKAPEELYDLQTDRDEVVNLVNSAAHRPILEKLRSAQRAHLEAIHDAGFLPEGEMHARAQGASPYDMARDPAKYPFRRIFEAADLASRITESETRPLRKLFRDPDSAVRYWAARGVLMRGRDAARAERALLRGALKDTAPYVRVVAAQALGQYGDDSDLAAALAVLRELAAPDRNGFFVAMASLAAIEALGPKARQLHTYVATLKPDTGRPHSRYDSYIPNLVKSITGNTPSP